MIDLVANDSTQNHYLGMILLYLAITFYVIAALGAVTGSTCVIPTCSSPSTTRWPTSVPTVINA